jgi:hypothetical protein
MSDREARALGADANLSPTFLIFVPSEDRGLLREFKTNRGSGMMLDDVYGRGKSTAMWTTPDRVYGLFGDASKLTREYVISVANALD